MGALGKQGNLSGCLAMVRDDQIIGYPSSYSVKRSETKARKDCAAHSDTGKFPCPLLLTMLWSHSPISGIFEMVMSLKG